MPQNKEPHTRISARTRSRRPPLVDITSVVNQLQNGASAPMEETLVLRYHALLAEARGGNSNDVKHQPQRSTGSKGRRGEGYTLRDRMELVEIFRHFSKRTGIAKITACNFGEFVLIPIKRQAIEKWDKSFDKIKFDVVHGRGNKYKLSSIPAD